MVMGVTEAGTHSGASGKGLDREVIVAAALQHIDRDGAQGLTMRALALKLGVGPMALYRYVSGREDLLEAVVAMLLDGVLRDISGEPASCWQEYLGTVAHAVRRIAVEHAGAFPLVATRHPAAPWLRPPLRSLEVVEDLVVTLGGHGFNDAQIADAYRAFSSFLLGQLLLESATRGAKTSPVQVAFDEGDARVPNQDGRAALKGVPGVARLRPLLSEDHSEEEFEISLENLLDRLEMSIAQ